MSRSRLASAVFGLPAVSFVPSSWAQFAQVSNTTATPVPGSGHDYLDGVNETVNPATGSAGIRIPVIVPPGRDITLPFSFAYASNGVNYLEPPTGTASTGFWSTIGTVTSQGGWSNTAPVVTVNQLHWTTIPEGAPKPVNCYALINFQFQNAKGNRHNLDPGAPWPSRMLQRAHATNIHPGRQSLLYPTLGAQTRRAGMPAVGYGL